MKPMSWSCGGRLLGRRWLWMRGRVGCSMLDCCLSREPLEYEPPLGAPLPLDRGAGNKNEVSVQKQQHACKHLTVPGLDWFLREASVPM